MNLNLNHTKQHKYYYIAGLLLALTAGSFMAGKVFDLEGCHYCFLQRVILISLSVCYGALGWLKDKPMAGVRYLIASLVSVSGVVVAWKHLSVIYFQQLMAFSGVVALYKQASTTLKQHLNTYGESLASLDWVFSTLPFWSLVLFLLLSTHLMFNMIRREQTHE